MESDDKLEGLSDPEESSSEARTWAGSDDEAEEAAPAAAATQHNYNLRYKRVVLDAVSKLTPARNIEIAPGVGVVADRCHVGGRDERIPGGSPGVNAESGYYRGGRKRVMREHARKKATSWVARRGIPGTTSRTMKRLAFVAGGQKRLASSAIGPRPCTRA